MKQIAKGWYLKSTIIIMATALVANAGVLESLDNELTSLVATTEPFLVTVEARAISDDKVLVGSGILIDNEGYIITTTSVIGDARYGKVKFKDGAEYKAQLVGLDFVTGLALLQIEPVIRLIPTMGNSLDIQDGSWVIVVGNSYEMPNAVNLGVYSGLTNEGFLQLSVQTGPGGSGSAVLNTRGELIGILVAQASETVSLALPQNDSGYISMASDYGGPDMPADYTHAMGIELPASGTSLALPVARIEKTIAQLKEFGKASHGFLGIRQKPLALTRKEKLGLEGGVEVVEVIKGGSADKAGIEKGDIISKFDNQIIKCPGHLYSLVRSQTPDDKVTVELIHDGKKRSAKVTLGKAPDDGYFGFIQPSRNSAAEIHRPATKLAEAAPNINGPAADAGNAQQAEYIAKLENRLSELEKQLKELTAQIDSLNQKPNNK